MLTFPPIWRKVFVSTKGCLYDWSTCQKCKICDLTVNSECELSKHKNKSHNNDNSYECYNCSKYENTKHLLRIHMHRTRSKNIKMNTPSRTQIMKVKSNVIITNVITNRNIIQITLRSCCLVILYRLYRTWPQSSPIHFFSLRLNFSNSTPLLPHKISI